MWCVRSLSSGRSGLWLLWGRYGSSGDQICIFQSHSLVVVSWSSGSGSGSSKNIMRHLSKDPSVPPNRYATCDWYYHAPLKQTEKTSRGVDIPPTSQIPGLSDLAEPHNELKNEGRKKWIKDTDSDYVKLAKQGGRPDLLKHVESPQKKVQPVSYAPPDWYSHQPSTPPETTAAPLRNIPDYMIHEEVTDEKNDQKYESKRGPIEFDQKTIWQRDQEENEKENHYDKKVKLPAINPKFMNDNAVIASGKGAPKAKAEKLGKKCFFPPMPGNKPDSVNFGKLLSNGYGDEWYRQQGDQDKKPALKSKMKGLE
ncbi:uncharacterized protein C7orf57 homolog [Leptodactylus fuscus]|uniref:uncharacterized protein C7orf57 homolog n=1 Tax=Leptodactylus fuscus TaxID=238119 RepID=UPI003F4E557C